MEFFTLVLALAELVAIIVLIIVAVKQRRALSKHVKKLKKTFEALKESLEQQIEKVGNHEEINRLRKEMKETLESHRRMMNEKIGANQIKYENAVQRISDKLSNSLDRLSGIRSRIAGGIQNLGRILVAALRGEEEELLKALAESEKKGEVPAAEPGEESLE